MRASTTCLSGCEPGPQRSWWGVPFHWRIPDWEVLMGSPWAPCVAGEGRRSARGDGCLAGWWRTASSQS
eukprot:10157529-Alexandrium_andersonii.AAC.1